MKKIVFVSHGLGEGGSERVASILANRFSEKDYKVLYLAVYTNTKIYKLDSLIEYKYITCNSFNKITRYVSRSKLLCKYIRKFSPDYIISFITQEMLYTTILNKYRMIFSERCDPSRYNKRIYFTSQFLFEKSYKVVFQTDVARRLYNKSVQNKGVVISNPMETESLPLWRNNKHKKDIITACRITPQKNLSMLIKAFNQIKNKYKDYNLIIYGEKRSINEYNKIMDLIHCFKIEDRVYFPGFANDMHQIMAESALFVLSSDYEGLSNSLLEALCIGIPTICTDSSPGGNAEYIRDGVNGFLVKCNDDKVLAEKMSLLLDNIELQYKFSNNSITLRKQLDTERIVNQWEKIFE